MSKRLRPFYLIFAATIGILQIFTNAAAQDIDVRIEVKAETGSDVRVSGRFPKNSTIKGRRNLSFPRSFAGFDGLGERISDVILKDEKRNVLSFQKPVPGEFVADADFAEWSYSINLSPRKEQSAAAHVSWLSKDTGILMLGDLLPRLGSSSETKTTARLSVELPEGWRAFSEHLRPPAYNFASENIEDAVIYVGRELLNVPAVTEGTRFYLVWKGERHFSIKEMADSAKEVYAAYRRIFAYDLGGDIPIAILDFPIKVGPGAWQAETRGRNITIISSDMPFKTQSVQRLHEQLRHEMFHLWIPNGVNLSGNYDWFYEGFALYQSLKTAVALNRIRFEDFLDTLSRAQAIDARQMRRMSLIEASNNRFSGADTQVYARGMVTAFLCDVVLLHNSKGKRSITDLFRELYAKHRYPNPRTDGNAAVLVILQNNKELTSVTERYINGPQKFELRTELIMAGLETNDTNNLSVMPKLNGRQKDLLDKLGYNNWRKLSPNTR